jgi:hypothetical protein
VFFYNIFFLFWGWVGFFFFFGVFLFFLVFVKKNPIHP